MMGHRSGRDPKMVVLMVGSNCHQAVEPQCFDHLLFADHSDDHADFVAFDFRRPACLSVEEWSVYRDQTMQRLDHVRIARDIELYRAIRHRLLRLGLGGEKLHIDKMSLKSGNIYGVPICVWVLSEYVHDFSQSSESGLTNLRWVTMIVGVLRRSWAAEQKCRSKGKSEHLVLLGSHFLYSRQAIMDMIKII